MTQVADTDIPLPGFVPDGLEQPLAGQEGPRAPLAPASPAAAPRTPDTPDTPDAAVPDAPGPDAGLSPLEQRLEARLEAHLAAQRADWQARQEGWRAQVERDPELGGEHLEDTITRARLALQRFDADGSIARLLDASGYGNHPAIVRFFSRLADAVMEDAPVAGRPGGSLAPLEERMYAGWRAQG